MSENRDNRYHNDPYHPSNWCVKCDLYYCWQQIFSLLYMLSSGSYHCPRYIFQFEKAL